MKRKSSFFTAAIKCELMLSLVALAGFWIGFALVVGIGLGWW